MAVVMNKKGFAADAMRAVARRSGRPKATAQQPVARQPVPSLQARNISRPSRWQSSWAQPELLYQSAIQSDAVDPTVPLYQRSQNEAWHHTLLCGGSVSEAFSAARNTILHGSTICFMAEESESEEVHGALRSHELYALLLSKLRGDNFDSSTQEVVKRELLKKFHWLELGLYLYDANTDRSHDETWNYEEESLHDFLRAAFDSPGRGTIISVYNTWLAHRSPFSKSDHFLLEDTIPTYVVPAIGPDDQVDQIMLWLTEHPDTIGNIPPCEGVRRFLEEPTHAMLRDPATQHPLSFERYYLIEHYLPDAGEPVSVIEQKLNLLEGLSWLSNIPEPGDIQLDVFMRVYASLVKLTRSSDSLPDSVQATLYQLIFRDRTLAQHLELHASELLSMRMHTLLATRPWEETTAIFPPALMLDLLQWTRGHAQSISPTSLGYWFDKVVSEEAGAAVRRALQVPKLARGLDFRRGLVAFLSLRIQAGGQAADKMAALLQALPDPNTNVHAWSQWSRAWSELVNFPEQALAALRNESGPIDAVISSYRQAIINQMQSALQFTTEETAQLRSSLESHPDFWYFQDFLRYIALAGGFSDELGKNALKELLLELSQSAITGEEVDYQQRYAYLYDIFSKKLVDRWSSRRSYTLAEFSPSEGPDPLTLFRESARTTRHRILGHIQISSSALRGKDAAAYRTALVDYVRRAQISDARAERDATNRARGLASILYRMAHEADAEQADIEWYVHRIDPLVKYFRENRDALEASGLAHMVDLVPMLQGFLREARTEHKRQETIQGYVEIIDAPQAMLVRGIYPTSTCQRANEATGSNESGELVNPLRYGQFLLVNFIDTASGMRRVAGRMIIELTDDEEVGRPAILGNNIYATKAEYSLLMKAAIKHDAEHHLGLDSYEDLFFLDEEGEIAPPPLDLQDIFPHRTIRIYRD